VDVRVGDDWQEMTTLGAPGTDGADAGRD